MNSGRNKNGGVPVPCKGKPKKGLNPDGAFLIYQMLHIQQFTDKMVGTETLTSALYQFSSTNNSIWGIVLNWEIPITEKITANLKTPELEEILRWGSIPTCSMTSYIKHYLYLLLSITFHCKPLREKSEATSQRTISPTLRGIISVTKGQEALLKYSRTDFSLPKPKVW